MTTLTRKAVAATTETAEDIGVFSALAATWSVDRQNEQIVPGAFAASIAAWAETGRSVPLHWDHKGSPADIIGAIDSTTMAETDEGLYVEGKLDIKDSEVAREVWRSVKSNTIGLSFGFLVKSDRVRNDGVRELLALDLFEVSLTPAPVNPNARVLSHKSDVSLRSQMRDQMLAVLRDEPTKRLDEMSLAELKAYGEELTKDIKPPIQIVSFEC